VKIIHKLVNFIHKQLDCVQTRKQTQALVGML
jgi:hypothetical protein